MTPFNRIDLSLGTYSDIAGYIFRQGYQLGCLRRDFLLRNLTGVEIIIERYSFSLPMKFF